MANTKLALKPSEGIYYALPRKTGGYQIMSQRADETEDPAHMFYWPKVLRQLGHMWGKDLEHLETNYQAIPRGRIQKEFDPVTLEETGKYRIIHGGDVPLGDIKTFVLQDFGLYPLFQEGKVTWVVDDHEKMDADDREAFKRSIGVK